MSDEQRVVRMPLDVSPDCDEWRDGCMTSSLTVCDVIHVQIDLTGDPAAVAYQLQSLADEVAKGTISPSAGYGGVGYKGTATAKLVPDYHTDPPVEER